jgi:hypothetical protein
MASKLTLFPFLFCMVPSLNEEIGMPKHMKFDVKANDKIKKSQE